MDAALQLVAGWDRSLIEALESLRWAPLSALMVLASAWWVKGPLIAGVGLLADAHARRRWPLRAACAGGAFLVTSGVVALLKDGFDRARPPVAYPEITPLGALPGNASFPSGHAATAFATAVAVGYFCPRLRWPLVALAALVGFSRMYLGVHFGFDVLAGAMIGTVIGLGAAWSAARLAR